MTTDEAWKALIATAMRRNVVVAVGEHRAAIEAAMSGERAGLDARGPRRSETTAAYLSRLSREQGAADERQRLAEAVRAWKGDKPGPMTGPGLFTKGYLYGLDQVLDLLEDKAEPVLSAGAEG